MLIAAGRLTFEFNTLCDGIKCAITHDVIRLDHITEIIHRGDPGLQTLIPRWVALQESLGLYVEVTLMYPQWNPGGVFDSQAGFRKDRDNSDLVDAVLIFEDEVADTRGLKDHIYKKYKAPPTLVYRKELVDTIAGKKYYHWRGAVLAVNTTLEL